MSLLANNITILILHTGIFKLSDWKKDEIGYDKRKAKKSRTIEKAGRTKTKLKS